jgi:type II secretory pathway component PulK
MGHPGMMVATIAMRQRGSLNSLGLGHRRSPAETRSLLRPMLARALIRLSILSLALWLNLYVR